MTRPALRARIRCRAQDGCVPSTFTLVTESAHSLEELFDLSLDIDAHVASMSESKERAVAGVTTGRIGLGETVTWRARHFGVWFTMTSEISELDDRITVGSPILGRLTERLILVPYLRRLITQRNAHLLAALG